MGCCRDGIYRRPPNIRRVVVPPRGRRVDGVGHPKRHTPPGRMPPKDPPATCLRSTPLTPGSVPSAPPCCHCPLRAPCPCVRMFSHFVCTSTSPRPRHPLAAAVTQLHSGHSGRPGAPAAVLGTTRWRLLADGPPGRKGRRSREARAARQPYAPPFDLDSNKRCEGSEDPGEGLRQTEPSSCWPAEVVLERNRQRTGAPRAPTP